MVGSRWHHPRHGSPRLALTYLFLEPLPRRLIHEGTTPGLVERLPSLISLEFHVWVEAHLLPPPRHGTDAPPRHREQQPEQSNLILELYFYHAGRPVGRPTASPPDSGSGIHAIPTPGGAGREGYLPPLLLNL